MASVALAAKGNEQVVLPLRRRPDLICRPARYGQRRYWNIKDPVSLRYFQLREEEYFILKALDGQTSAATIRERFEAQFSPLRLGPTQLQEYLLSLRNQGLVLTETPGEGAALRRRRRAWLQIQRLASPTRILALRFRGFDPERLLRRLYPACRWMFTRGALLAAGVLVVGALLLVAVQYEVMLRRLPDFHAFFNLRNVVWIAAATAVAKVLHELGHALTCKHFGGECHEMGIMLLVFTPCLYCNVSDAWLMPSRWQRAAVSAAGIGVEIVLAAACTFLWWFSEPGLLNTICLNIMFVCSVSTLLFNGNPLLRYDGYYVLADLVEVPNLRQRATGLVGGLLATWCLGVPRPNERVLPERGRAWLFLYGIGAVVYPFVVMLGILWFLHAILRPYGLGIVAQAMSVLFIGGIVLTWGQQGVRFLRRVLSRGEVQRPRAVGFLASAVVLVLGLCFIPLPRQVAAPAVVEARDAQRVFVTVKGRLPGQDAHRRAAGDRVRQGDVLAELENPQVAQEVLRLESQVAVLRARVAALAAIRVRDARAGSQLPSTEEALRHLESQLEQRREQQRQLHLIAPCDGVVLPDQRQAARTPPEELDGWSGTPLDPALAGCALEAGTLYCLVGDPARLAAVLVVDQAEIEFVRVGQPVRLWLRELPGRTLRGSVLEVAESQMTSIPEPLLAQRELSVVLESGGTPRLASPSFQVRVALEPVDAAVPLRSTGWGKIQVASQSPAQRLYRYLASTFRFL